MAIDWQELTSGVSANGRVFTVSQPGGGTIKLVEIQIAIGQEMQSFTFTGSGTGTINVLQMYAASSNGTSAAVAITGIDFTNLEAQVYYSIGSSGSQPASWTLGGFDLENL